MIEPSKIGTYAAKYEKENCKFRVFLKRHANCAELDKQFLELHNELFAKYDCCKCNNCCKLCVIPLKIKEVKLIAELLEINESDFISQYLECNADEETEGKNYVIKERPCCFLDPDGKCKVQKCKPSACRDYPFTNKRDRLSNMFSVIESAGHCPIVFEMLERLKKIYGFKSRKN
ncbi:MAG: YkgJ family cysteine cluster protein [Holosporales bacterium]|jgi:Fe-S-cluster containining protein|nr:YkgJ family cysteine cluster protein [Holosporales bacterium]